MDLEKELERIRKKYNADWDEEDHDRDENLGDDVVFENADEAKKFIDEITAE